MQYVFAGGQGGEGDLGMAVAWVQMSTRSTSSRAIEARQSVSAAAQPCRSAMARTALASRPQTAARIRAARQVEDAAHGAPALEWAAPMKAYPTMPTRSVGLPAFASARALEASPASTPAASPWCGCPIRMSSSSS